MLKKVKLPEYIHVWVVEFHKTRPDVKQEARIPSKWVKFEGQEKYSQFSWNKRFKNHIIFYILIINRIWRTCTYWTYLCIGIPCNAKYGNDVEERQRIRF